MLRKYIIMPLLLVLMVISALFFQTGHADAYHLENHKWANQPAPHTCCANIRVQFYSGYWYPGDHAAFSNAMTAWNNSPALIVYSNSSSSPLFVNDQYNSGVSWDGITYYGWNSSGYLTYANVWLNYYYTQNYSSGEIQGVAVHELGHAVGLAHTSGCVIMVGDTYTRWTVCHISTPQTDDDNGIDAMY